MNVDKVINLARRHIAADVVQEQQARAHLANAIATHNQGEYDEAKRHALKSLSYSVGIHHIAYKRAAGV
jgi:hypothetical protein